MRKTVGVTGGRIFSLVLAYALVGAAGLPASAPVAAQDDAPIETTGAYVPPDPEDEREPNDDDVSATAYGIGERRVGSFDGVEDVDYFRFSLAAPEHIGLRLEQPAEASTAIVLSSAQAELLHQEAPEPGDTFEMDLFLRSGDYVLSLQPQLPTNGTYELTTERRDPFAVPADAEPNDNAGLARVAPASLRWSGDRSGKQTDMDAFRLPPLDAPGPMQITMDTESPWLRLWTGTGQEELVPETEGDGVYVLAEPPVGVPLYLEHQPEGPYEITLEAPGWTPVPEAERPPVDIDVELETDLVAAYWPYGQQVDGQVRLTNTGPDELALDLEAITSHYAWHIAPEATAVDVPAGATVEVPVTLAIDPDPWAAYPVQVSVAARTASGGTATGSATIDADPDVEPVNSHVDFAIPDELLGGLNVAAASLGAEPAGDPDLDWEPPLYDGVTPPAKGFARTLSHGNEVVVDLAGDAPIPIAGTIINPLARGWGLGEIARHFDLLLSTDGVNWQTALSDEIQVLPIDQAFVLEESVPATHAMLRLHDTQTDSHTVSLGEWKVVAEPGVAPDPMPTNIADPARGGNVVRYEPYRGTHSYAYGLLDANPDPGIQIRDGARALEMVVGFKDGRAAQITDLEWQRPAETTPDTLIPAVAVQISLDGALGPWQDVGGWDLSETADGGTTRFTFDEPVWARYVRLSAPISEEYERFELPTRLQVHERPPDDSYRSVLGEWGEESRRGPYELLVPNSVSELALGPDAADTQADATPLEPGVTTTDRAEIFEDVDWYRIEVPSDVNTLRFDLEGVPTVGVAASLFTPDGDPVEMSMSSLPAGVVRYETAVEGGGTYDLLVEQPPFDVVFTFDTSGHLGPSARQTLANIEKFAADIRPGREMAMIVPFDQEPLLDTWEDQPAILVDAVNGFVAESYSSAVERGLLAASELLSERDGLRTILVVTDAETESLSEGLRVWEAFDSVEPIVYAVHRGANIDPLESSNLMHGWADAFGGHYAYATTHAETDRSFERMTARLRRPSVYALTPETALVDHSPGTIAVSAAAGRPSLTPDVAVEIILDTSGSMRKRIDGERRIQVAKNSMRKLLTKTLDEGVPVAIRTFGAKGKGKGAGCKTRLALPLAPLDRKAALRFVKKLEAPKKASTPIAAALEQVPGDLQGVEGSRIVLLITDGAESCDGDPNAAIESLRQSGFDVTLNIVGFALDDEALKAQMAEWAAAGSGSYFDAAGAQELADAVSTALSAPFRVYAADAADGAEPVASGVVGGGSVTVEPGAYRVEVLTDPVLTFEDVIIEGGANETLDLTAE